MAKLSLPPFLRDVRTDEIFQFHPQAAKNPHLVPHWDAPDWITSLPPEKREQALTNAINAAASFNLSEADLVLINEVRRTLGAEKDIVVTQIGESQNSFGKTRTLKGKPVRPVDTFESTL